MKDLSAQVLVWWRLQFSAEFVGRRVCLRVASVFDCCFVSCLRFLEACALTTLFKANVLVNFVDFLIHMVTDIPFPDRK